MYRLCTAAEAVASEDCKRRMCGSIICRAGVHVLIVRSVLAIPKKCPRRLFTSVA